MLNLIKKKTQEYDNYNTIDKFYLYFKDPNEAKYQYLIKEPAENSVENLKNPKTLIRYSNNMQGVYGITDREWNDRDREYNQTGNY